LIRNIPGPENPAFISAVPPIGNRPSPVLPVEQVARGLSSRVEAAAKSSEREQRTPAGARGPLLKNI
jgi:hypothetical protein